MAAAPQQHKPQEQLYQQQQQQQQIKNVQQSSQSQQVQTQFKMIFLYFTFVRHRNRKSYKYNMYLNLLFFANFLLIFFHIGIKKMKSNIELIFRARKAGIKS